MEKKSRSENSSAVRNIPDDIWSEILSTLPVKFLLRSRSVSPSWRAIIDSPKFARLHLTRSPKDTHIFFAHGRHQFTQTCAIRCSQTLQLTATLHPPPIDPISVNRWRVVYSIDGLFMLRIFRSGRDTNYMLWNPSIRKSRKLPLPPKICTNQLLEVQFGFGFDPSLNDYKYLRLAKNIEGLVHLVQVYTMGTNSWRSIDVKWCSYFVNFIDDLRSLCLGGVLYTLGSDKKSGPVGLVSFDLRSEVFACTRLPVEDCTGESRMFHFQALTMMIGDDDSLVFVDMKEPKMTVWVTERVGGDFQSLIWTKLYTFSGQIDKDGLDSVLSGAGSFLHLKKNGELLLNCNDIVTSYNLETGEEKILLENGELYGNNNTWPYIESLVLY